MTQVREAARFSIPSAQAAGHRVYDGPLEQSLSLDSGEADFVDVKK